MNVRINHIKLVFKHTIIPRNIERVSARDRISTRQPENSRAADHRQLTRRQHDLIPPGDADGAPVVLPRREDEVEVDRDGAHLQVGRRGGPLHPAHGGRPDIRPRCHEVVHDADGPEPRGGGGGDGGVRDSENRCVRPAGAEIVHVDTKPRDFFIVP